MMGGLDGNGAGTAKGVAERIAAPVFGEEHHGGGQSLPQRRRDAHRPIAPFVEAGGQWCPSMRTAVSFIRENWI